MKAQERHELKENDLVSWFQYGLPLFLKRNGSYFLLVLALAFLGFQLWRLHERRQEDTRIKAWNDLRMSWQAEDVPSSLKTVIETYDLKDVREKAYLDLGKAYSELQPFPEKLKAMNMTRAEVLTGAYDAYQKAFNLYGSDDLIAGKAMLGMAGVEEDRGEWDQAKKLYEQMTDKGGRFAGTPTAEAAAARLKTLDARRNAPRLTQEIKIPPPSTATAPATGTALPGRFGNLPDVETPSTRPSPGTAPAVAPSLPAGVVPVVPMTMPATTTPR